MNYYNPSLYFEAHKIASEISANVSNYLNKDIRFTKCFDIEFYVRDIENVDFFDHTFKKQMKRKMLGSTSKVLDKVVIITTNRDLRVERKNYTKMHEIIHYYRDIPFVKAGHEFYDLLDQNFYKPEDIEKEYRANIGASILLANDIALEYAIQKFNTFNEVADYFFMSKSALHNRLDEHLVYVQNIHPNNSYKIVNMYRNGNKKVFYDIFFK